MLAGVAQADPLHTLSIQSDGRDEMRVSGSSMTVEHSSWGFPSALMIDGVATPMTFSGNTSNSIAVPLSGDYWVKKSLGRDGGYAVQRSTGYALASVDNPDGSDVYQFDFYNAPQENTTDWMHVVGAGATPGHMLYSGTAGYGSQPLGTTTTFSLTVDGGDEVMFTGGNLVIRHLSRENPTALTINGVAQTLNFTGNLSNAIPLSLPDDLQFAQTGGRVTLYPVETPLGLLIGANDELVGADVYTWTITAVPEPASLITLLVMGIPLALTRQRHRRFEN
jgi:hypothetical protein